MKSEQNRKEINYDDFIMSTNNNDDNESINCDAYITEKIYENDDDIIVIVKMFVSDEYWILKLVVVVVVVGFRKFPRKKLDTFMFEWI